MPADTVTGEQAMRGGSAAVGAERFTQARVERIIQLVIGVGCAVLGIQAFLNALGSVQEAPAAHLPLMVAAFGPLAAMVLACVIGVGVRWAAGLLAMAFPLVLIGWFIATEGRHDLAADQPWVWYLINVAAAAAVLAFPLPAQIVWAVLIPVLYGIVRTGQLDGRSPATTTVVLEAVFGTILAGVIVSLGWMLRTAALRIDHARRDALDSAARAAATEAVESERIAVAALMHDSVLAALLAAERAQSPRERLLAATMAREALTRLANAERDVGEGSDEPVRPECIAEVIQTQAADLAVGLSVTRDVDADAAVVPGRTARALALAATQAIANAVQHAGGQGLTVGLRADARGVVIEVKDAGGGFDPRRVPEDRLGIRGSIVARMAAHGGRARIDTTDEGTTVTLEWSGR